ncbi:prepilin peptidase [Lactobacillus helsingborgensis]|uniref:prepilin peptidase n=1 Tax=Lactobacillus helsingborgensis TaxID=1218494 RepID=UPI0027407D17|nr:A24 family peptidase [Lactobacillus helsingborgensis]WLT00032.1 prepilin peptidase [Lactobacillus helsingborgensis]
MDWLFNICSFLIGTCLASHACVVVDRLGKEDFIFSRSKCNYCGCKLCLLDEIPLISYLFLKGRCRYCHSAIPIEYWVIEFIGGSAYCTINFADKNNILTAVVIFCLLLAAISDYQKQSFDVILILPALILALLQVSKTVPQYTIVDYFQLLPILILFIYEIYRQKLGSGDLLIYLILSFYFQPEFANFTLLLASILVLIKFISIQVEESEPIAFVPFIFLGLTIQLLSS